MGMRRPGEVMINVRIPRRTTIDPEVVSAISSAYYPQIVSLPESARNRAQAAFGIASAIGASLGFGVLTGLEDSASVTKALGFSALSMWGFTAALYIFAVSSAVSPVRRRDDVRSDEEFVFTVVGEAKAERDQIDARQRRATFGAGMAAFVTLMAIATSLVVSEPASTIEASAVLTEGAAAAITEICPNASDGRLEVSFSGSLDDKTLVTMKLDDSECGPDRVLSLPRENIVGIVTKKTK